MSDEEFDQFLGASLQELEVKQEQLTSEFGLGGWPRFVVDYTAGSLQFFENEALRVDTTILPIGTHVSESESFQWAWANEQYPEEVRAAAARMKGLCGQTGMEFFVRERVTCDDAMAWEVTAMVCKYLGALGAYRVPHGRVNAYVLITAARAV